MPQDPDEALSRDIVSQNVAFHEAQARLYDLSHPELTNAFQRFMLRRDIRLMRGLLREVEQPLAVDVGAGTGRLSLALARAGFDVIALDNSPAMLAVLQRRYERLREPKGDLRAIVAGADDLGPHLSSDRPVHVVGFSSVLHHLPDYLGAVKLAGQLLAPGGCLYITHEPLPAQVRRQTPAMQAVRLLDTLLRTPQQLYKNLVRYQLRIPRPPAAPLLDYHDAAGLDMAALTALLEELGYEVIMQRRYKDRKMAVVAMLDTYVFMTPNWRFALLAQHRNAMDSAAGPVIG